VEDVVAAHHEGARFRPQESVGVGQQSDSKIGMCVQDVRSGITGGS
jgi:hypothetical protein